MKKKTATATDMDSIISFNALNGPVKDASVYNFAAPDPGSTIGLPDLATPGETIRGKLVYGFSGDSDPNRAGTNNVFNQLYSGQKQDTSDGVITFGFLDQQHVTGLNNNPAFGEGKGYTAFTPAQQAAARIAMQSWDDLIAPRFVEVTNGPGASTWASKTVDIMLANTTTGPAQAYAYYPGYGNQYERVAGDVWVADPRVNGSNGQLSPGFYGLQTLNHEIGHGIGLSHPGNYNFGADTNGDGIPDPITYVDSAFYYQDNNQYTIMSYFDSYELGNNQIDWNLMRFVFPSTPMVDDVRVAQAIYGADMSTRTGDTTYGFNSTTDVTNPAMKFVPNEMFTIFTIWDAGGTDTLDLSGYKTGSIIDLRPGAYSSAGGLGAYDGKFLGIDPSTVSKTDYLSVINGHNAALVGTDPLFTARTAAYDLYFGGRTGANEGVPWIDIMGHDTLMENNIGIAYGATIENAIGGSGNDRINGNEANNVFTGNLGADMFVFAKYGPNDTSVDHIKDFSHTQGDKIDLTALDPGAGFDFSFLGSAAFTGHAGEVRYAGGQVQIDLNGDAVSDFAIVLDNTPPALVATDFVFG